MSTNPNTIKNQDCRNCKLSDEECSFGCVKSQDELNLCNEGKRKSDVLLEAISKAEKLQKQLDIALKGLQELQSMEFERYLMVNGWVAVGQMRDKTIQIRKQIQELDND